jgi:hypothetical protein
MFDLHKIHWCLKFIRCGHYELSAEYRGSVRRRSIDCNARGDVEFARLRVRAEQEIVAAFMFQETAGDV